MKITTNATRPLHENEYRRIIELLNTGFVTKDRRVFKPNKQISTILQLQANLGLRIGDVLALRVNSIRNGRLETIEEKSGRIQFREVNPAAVGFIKDYAIEQMLSPTDRLFSIQVRVVQKQLKIVVDYLGLKNISTHSFRKMFATAVYNDNGCDIKLLQEILNHTSIATTERYIRVSQFQIDRASASVNFVVL